MEKVKEEINFKILNRFPLIFQFYHPSSGIKLKLKNSIKRSKFIIALKLCNENLNPRYSEIKIMRLAKMINRKRKKYFSRNEELWKL